MAGLKSNKETSLNYTIQPFSKQFSDDISSVQLLLAKDKHTFLSLKFYEILTNYLPFIVHSTLQNLRKFDYPS